MLFFCVFGLKIELCRTNRPVPVNGGGDLLTDRGLQRTPDVVGRRCCRRTSPDCRRPRSSLGVVGRLQAADVDRRLGRPPLSSLSPLSRRRQTSSAVSRRLQVTDERPPQAPVQALYLPYPSSPFVQQASVPAQESAQPNILAPSRRPWRRLLGSVHRCLRILQTPVQASIAWMEAVCSRGRRLRRRQTLVRGT